MSALGDVLETVHAGRGRYETLRGTVREWRHFPRGRQAFSRVMSRRGTPPDEATLVAGAPEEGESLLKVWVAKPGRMRLERPTQDGTAVTVVDGDRWWSYHPTEGYTAADDGDRVGTTVVLEALLDPWDLLGPLDLAVRSELELLGRPAVALDGRSGPQRGRTVLPGLGQGADAYELVLDREYGVLLRTAALLDGEPFDVKEFVDVAFDAELPADVFAFPG